MAKKYVLMGFYMVLNVGFIAVILNLLFEAEPLLGITAGVVLYAASIALAFSPVGEFIVRIKEGARKNKEVIDEVQPILNELLEEANRVYGSVPNNIEIRVKDGFEVNASAIGLRTICVTPSILNLSEREIKAVLSHELGHIINKDTYPVMLVSTGNIVVVTIVTVIRLVINLLQLVFSIVCLFVGGSDSALASATNALANMLINVFVTGFTFLWTKLGMLLVVGSTISKEYEADKVATELGYGYELRSILQEVLDSGYVEKRSIFAFAHPDIKKRIAKIDEMMA